MLQPGTSENACIVSFNPAYFSTGVGVAPPEIIFLLVIRRQIARCWTL